MTSLATVTALHDMPTARRVHANAALLAGGGRALLMQIAHPSVARGVVEHSDYARNPIERLARTLRHMLALVYGDEDAIERSLRTVNGLHERVAGQGYAATDPDLLLWVHATLVDTSLRMHALLVRPLSAIEARKYYEETQAIGEALGVPRDAFPADLRAFHAYVTSMTESLRVSDEARDIARELFRPRGLQTPALLGARLLTAAFLPASLRAQYGMSWGPKRQAVLSGTAKLSRMVHPSLPRFVKQTPSLLLPEGARLG